MADLTRIGSSALLAFQRALDTTGHNIANVGTDGYSRQRVLMETRPPQTSGAGSLGNGVQFTGVQRTTDSFVMERLLEAGSSGARLERFSTYAGRLDTLLSDTDSGLSQPLQSYFDALQALSADPTSSAARNTVIGAAKTLAARFQSLQTQLEAMDADVDARLSQAAQEVTSYSAQIAAINREIAQATAAGGGQPPNDLLDQRERLLGALAEQIGISTVAQDDGSVNVFAANGQALVLGFSSSRLTATADPYEPQRLALALDTGTGIVRIDASASGGEIGGLLDARRELIDPAMDELGRLAVSLASTVNAQHRAGMDATGALGADFFTVPAGIGQSASTNTGGASLSVGYGDLALLTGDRYRLAWDGAAWSATEIDNGASVAVTGAGTNASPLLVGGLSIVVGGAPAAGDSFRVQPGDAGGLRVAIGSATQVAAATPVRGSAALANTGTASIAGLTVTDATDPALLNTASVVFTGAGTYTIDGGPPQAWTAGQPIAANGWSFTLGGVPAAGDSFTIRSNVAGSSDNGNARLLGALSTAKVLDGGTASLGGAYAGLVARTGSAAQQASLQQDAMAAITTQLTAERDAVSGVNLDEEAANLIRYQQAYQAAAQILVTADELFETLLAAVRR